MISELHTKKGTWKITVRITDMWHVNKQNGRQAIEIVFMDQTNIKVVENHYEYKVSKIPFLVYLMKTSSIKEAEHPEIPPDVHVITRFTDIIIGVAPCDTLVDIVGVVVEVIERQTINPTYRVTVKLRDNRYCFCHSFVRYLPFEIAFFCNI
ncbi:hypothetical protein GmHk_11G032316 [Glycine max]|nr:hypothetical protein GmHk_11G032316 [Glycine max]